MDFSDDVKYRNYFRLPYTSEFMRSKLGHWYYEFVCHHEFPVLEKFL